MDGGEAHVDPSTDVKVGVAQGLQVAAPAKFE